MRPTAAPAYFPPTKRQQDALRFIRGYQLATGGVSPCFTEIGEGVGVASKNAVASLMDGLEERRLLRRMPNRARAIEVLTDISIPRSPTGEPLYFVSVPG